MPQIIRCVHTRTSGLLRDVITFAFRFLYRVGSDLEQFQRNDKRIRFLVCLLNTRKRKKVHLQSFSSWILDFTDGDAECLFVMLRRLTLVTPNKRKYLIMVLVNNLFPSTKATSSKLIKSSIYSSERTFTNNDLPWRSLVSFMVYQPL